MKPSNVRQITSENFKPEERELIDRIGDVLNYFMNEITSILSDNVDFDNTKWTITSLQARVDANGIPLQRIRFTSKVNVPRGIIVVNTQNLTNLVNYPSSGVTVSFTPKGNGLVEINHITGIPAEDKHNLTLVVV